MKKLLTLSVLALAAVLPAQAQKLVIKGSDTLGAKLVPMLAEEYKAKNPGVSFEIAAEVAKNPNGIGYVGLAYLSDPGIKTAAIDGSLPTEESVLKKTYPYARPTFYYTNGEPTGEAAKFLNFTLSDDGQKIVRKVGFVPVRKL